MTDIISIVASEDITLDKWRHKLLQTMVPRSKVELKMPKTSFTFTRAFLTIFNIIAQERECEVKFNNGSFGKQILLPKYYSEPNITRPNTG